MLLTTFCTVRAMTCPILISNIVRVATQVDLRASRLITILTLVPLSSVMGKDDPTLPRYGTDLVASAMREMQQATHFSTMEGAGQRADNFLTIRSVMCVCYDAASREDYLED